MDNAHHSGTRRLRSLLLAGSITLVVVSGIAYTVASKRETPIIQAAAPEPTAVVTIPTIEPLTPTPLPTVEPPTPVPTFDIMQHNRVTRSWPRYTNSDGGYGLQYPPTWTIKATASTFRGHALFESMPIADGGVGLAGGRAYGDLKLISSTEYCGTSCDKLTETLFEEYFTTLQPKEKGENTVDEVDERVIDGKKAHFYSMHYTNNPQHKVIEYDIYLHRASRDLLQITFEYDDAAPLKDETVTDFDSMIATVWTN